MAAVLDEPAVNRAHADAHCVLSYHRGDPEVRPITVALALHRYWATPWRPSAYRCDVLGALLSLGRGQVAHGCDPPRRGDGPGIVLAPGERRLATVVHLSTVPGQRSPSEVRRRRVDPLVDPLMDVSAGRRVTGTRT